MDLGTWIPALNLLKSACVQEKDKAIRLGSMKIKALHKQLDPYKRGLMKPAASRLPNAFHQEAQHHLDRDMGGGARRDCNTCAVALDGGLACVVSLKSAGTSMRRSVEQSPPFIPTLHLHLGCDVTRDPMRNRLFGGIQIGQMTTVFVILGVPGMLCEQCLYCVVVGAFVCEPVACEKKRS